MSVSIPLIQPDSPSAAKPAGDREIARRAPISSGARWFRSVWFSLLLASICFEGLGRRYLPSVPSTIFYFLKDVVLGVGLIRFRINREVKTVFLTTYRPYLPYLKLAILWTFAELLNPRQGSFALGLLGLRAYWFWWLAPFVVASVLLDPTVRRKVVMLQAGVAMVVALLAFLQFGAPADSIANTYTVVDGKEVQAVEITTTGRVRVSSTFSFISGFTDFAVLVPVLLLSIGLGEKNRNARMAALVATLFSAAALPMSGSRAPFVISLALCALVAWRAGLVFTAMGRRVIVLAVAAGFTTVFAFPEALQGVMDRFDSADTNDRFNLLFSVLPPVPLATENYPLMGIGTGMMQNFREKFGVFDQEYAAEYEFARYLVELGPLGYLLVWIAKFGLIMTLWRFSKLLKKAGRRAAAGAALGYAVLTFYGHMTFDHTFAALYFVGFGFILQEAVQAWPVVHGRRMPAKMPIATWAKGDR